MHCLHSPEPPIFVKRLEPTTVWKKGSSARLQCTVKGSPELHVTWFLNDKELSTNKKYRITFKEGLASLEISDVALLDSGNYTCEVLNEAGCESCSTKLTVKGLWTQLFNLIPDFNCAFRIHYLIIL